MDKPRILIVEDDSSISEMLTTYFTSQQYDVLTAIEGREALQLCQEEPLSLIMLDIRLPDISGYDVCRQLRQQRTTQHIPIIFLTEKSDRIDKLHGLELGVVDYITKPFDLQELALRVRNAIIRADREHNTNAVTDLPEGALVEEKLNQMIYSEAEWAVLLLSISKFSEFRELYGFVAADDVLRAIALIIRNAVREHGSENDFVGHTGPEQFVVVASPDSARLIRERLEARLEQSREYFYPVRDRQKVRENIETDHLRMESALVTSSDGPFDSIKQLFDAAANATET